MEIPKLSGTGLGYSRKVTYHFKLLRQSLHDGCERAEAIGLLKQLQGFSFLLLWVFDDILGVTKLLSDTAKQRVRLSKCN